MVVYDKHSLAARFNRIPLRVLEWLALVVRVVLQPLKVDEK